MLGTLVFVLIIIPVAVAALEALNIDAISRPAVVVLTTVLNAIPLVLAAAIVLAIGFAIGRGVASLVERLLPATGFDRAIGALGSFSSYTPDPTLAPDATVEAAPAPSPRLTPSKIVAQLVLWAIVAFSAIEAARLLQFASIAAILEEVVSLAGRVVLGGVIITASVIIADLLSNAIDRSTSGADRFASVLVKWATIALGTAMGLSFMGIADEIVMLAFGLTLGSAAVAAALAFGLGGRDAAGRLAARWLSRAEAKGDIPKTLGLFVTPGNLSERYPGDLGMSNPDHRAPEYDALSDTYVRMLTEELLPEVAKRWRFASDPARRAIGGTSSGAIAAWTAAWHRPDAFGNVISFIGSYTSIGYRPATVDSPMEPGGDLYPGLIRKSPIRPIKVFLQDGSGDLDNEHGNWFLANRQMLAALSWANRHADETGDTGARYTVRHEWGDGAHSDAHGGMLLPEVLRWLWGKPAPAGD